GVQTGPRSWLARTSPSGATARPRCGPAPVQPASHLHQRRRPRSLSPACLSRVDIPTSSTSVAASRSALLRASPHGVEGRHPTPRQGSGAPRSKSSPPGPPSPFFTSDEVHAPLSGVAEVATEPLEDRKSSFAYRALASAKTPTTIRLVPTSSTRSFATTYR